MEPQKFTFEKCKEFLTIATDYRKKYDAKGRPIKDTIAETKTDYSLDKMIRRVQSAIKTLVQDLEEKKFDVFMESAVTVEREGAKVLMRDANGGLVYNADGEKKVRKENKKLDDQFAVKEVEIEPYMIQGELPKFTLAQWEAFRGFVIPDEEMPEPEDKVEEDEPIDVLVNGSKSS